MRQPIPVYGYCPFGCGRTLMLGTTHTIYCLNPDCPRPDGVAELLQDDETEHVVTVTADGVTIRHPLRERVDNALDDCTLLYALTVTHPPFVGPGRYRVVQDESGRPFGWQVL